MLLLLLLQVLVVFLYPRDPRRPSCARHAVLCVEHRVSSYSPTPDRMSSHSVVGEKTSMVFILIVRTTLSDSACDKRRLWVDAQNLAKCILPTRSHTLRTLSTYLTCKNKALMTKYPLSCRKCLVPIPGAHYRYDDSTQNNCSGRAQNKQ